MHKTDIPDKSTPAQSRRSIVCMVLGHVEYSPEVLRVEPWQDPDFYDYAKEDFREHNCLRCGADLVGAAELAA